MAKAMRRVLISLVLLVVVLGALALWTQRAVRRIEAAFPPTGTFVAIPGGRIHIVSREPVGSSRGDVLLLHGASANHGDLMAALGADLAAKGFRVIAVDRPGHGWSDRWPDSASPARQAQLIRTALETIGVHDAIVVGHSWSGALAEAFLLDQADFAQGGVLLAPVTHPWPGGISWYYTVATLPVIGPLFAHLVVPLAGLTTIEQGVASVFAPQRPPADYVSRTGATLVLRPAEFQANAVDVAGLKAFVTAQSPREPSIRQPVAILAGDTDSVVSTRIHSMPSVAAIPDATLGVLTGVGHSVHWAAPDLVVAAVEDVARRIEDHMRAARPATAASAPSTSSQ